MSYSERHTPAQLFRIAYHLLKDPRADNWTLIVALATVAKTMADIRARETRTLRTLSARRPAR